MTKGFVVWFTGIPCSGKSTLAQLLYDKLNTQGIPLEVFDGDVVRKQLSEGLGFSREDRIKNLHRIGYVTSLLVRNGVGCIVAAISPYQTIRDEFRKDIANYIEIFVDCPVEVCKARDVKGLYKKALAGEIKNFTGVSDPYEVPTNPDLIVQTAKESPERSVTRLLDFLTERKVIPDPYPQN